MRKKIILLVFAVILLLPLGTQQASAASVLYGADGSGNNPSTLYTINTLTGAALPVGAGIGFSSCGAMDFHPVLGILYAICKDATGANVLITINHITGIGALVAPVTGSIITSGQLGNGGVMDVSFRNIVDNTLYVTTFVTPSGGGASLELHTINIGNGISAFVGLTTRTAPGNGIAFSAGDTLFHIDQQDFNFLNQVTGAATTIGFGIPHIPPSGNARDNAMDFEPGTGILFSSTNEALLSGGGGPNFLSTVDTATGFVTIVGQTVNGLDAIAFLAQCPPGQGGFPDCSPLVAGSLIPIDTTMVLVAGAQSTSAWMIPVIVSAIGIGIVIARKF